MEHAAAELLITVVRALSPGGVYAIVSFRKQELLRRLFEFEELPFEALEHVELPAVTGESASFCRVRRRGGGAREPDLAMLRAHIDNVTDWWYQEQAPLLTRERRAEIDLVWSLAATHTTDGAEGLSLPLRAAFEILLTAEERTEVSYDDFLGDLLPFLRGYGLAQEGPPPSMITLHQGLEFLEHAQ